MRSPKIQVGRVIELTSEDYDQLIVLSDKLALSLSVGGANVAQTILQMFKIVQAAVRRSHAS